MADMKPSSISKAEVHRLEETGSFSPATEGDKKEKALAGAGNVQLILNNETVLIPTPSPDPKGTSTDLRTERPLTISQTLSTYPHGGSGLS
jgi:hypothetical protein